MTAPWTSRKERTDTCTDAKDSQIQVLRRLGGARRMELALEMSDEIALVSQDGARSRSNPRAQG